jgi:hypothetical protein
MKINIKKKVKRFIFITGHFLILNDKLYEDFFFKWSKHFGFMSENFSNYVAWQSFDCEHT